ncbi:sulfate ABC transporter permease subunit CysT [Brackiella oedipodis]|uniref:sulfate ABC transporter permease subunit CysT n=1 Tax=Brackiella oedipodis TaxID=124225 RepID=UPI00048E19F5|nr:sulfate ABC transporter permease subunit CysT [Brackiella oedipodis]
MNLLLKSRPILPGFGISLGISIFGISVLIFLPFIMMVLSSIGIGWTGFWNIISDPRVLSAVWLTLRLSILAALTNLVFGTLLAWVLVRYEFPGRKLLNAFVDLPFALPTAVTGIALATIYGPNGWIGGLFAEDGWIGSLIGARQIAFTSLGIWIALVVVSLPFVVRSVQPVLQELQPELEEAAATLGAHRATVVRRVILPELLPAMLTGAGMMFARATGEYGSIIFIAGNIPFETEILPLVITSKLEQFDVQGAAAVALFMLLISMSILFLINLLQWKYQKKILGWRS